MSWRTSKAPRGTKFSVGTSEGEKKKENKGDEWTINRGQLVYETGLCGARQRVIERVCEEHSKSKAN